MIFFCQIVAFVIFYLYYCSMKSKKTLDFIEYCSAKHNYKFDYTKTVYVKSKEKVIITCPVHGDFSQQAGSHKSGIGCRKCSEDAASLRYRHTKEMFVEKAKKVHGELFDYSQVDYINTETKVEIFCKKHKVTFLQTPHNHLNGQKCYECGREGFSKQRVSSEEYLKKVNKTHNGRYTYPEGFNGYKYKLLVKCNVHGEYRQNPYNHANGTGCPKCSYSQQTSKAEQEIATFLKPYVPKVQQNKKGLLDTRHEIDIYLNFWKLGIEYHGLYWHTDGFIEDNYHLNKLNLCNEKQINLIQIFEDEWVLKQEIVKSRLLNLIGKTPIKIYARKTQIKEVPTREAMQFLQENHLQGKVGASHKYGLYYNDELVSLMTFGGLRKNLGQTKKPHHYELIRFCNKLNTSVVGGASKLLKHFIKTNSPKNIISYADRRWSQGNLYENLGFEFVRNTQPNYFYTKGHSRENRFNYRKSQLIKEGFDKTLTEREIMQLKGFNRIYDCGAKLYRLNLEL